MQQAHQTSGEAALDGEITVHLGYDEGDPPGDNGGNSRIGSRCKTMRIEVGPIELTRLNAFETTLDCRLVGSAAGHHPERYGSFDAARSTSVSPQASSCVAYM